MAKKTKKNSGPGNPAKRAAARELDDRLAPGDQRVLREFSEWTQGQQAISAPNPEYETNALNGLFSSVRAAGQNPVAPEGVPALVEVCLVKANAAEAEQEGLAEQVLMACVGVLGDYLRFRQETSEDPRPWVLAREAAQEQVENALQGDEQPYQADPDGEGLLEGALDEAAAVAQDEYDSVQRRSWCLDLPVLAAVPTLLEWLGAGRDTDRSGELLTSDRPSVRRLLGDDTLPDPMLDAWWDNLITSDVIEVAGSRATAGESATAWGGSAGPDVQVAEELAAGLIAEVITRHAEESGRPDAVEATAWTLVAPVTGSGQDDAVVGRAQQVLAGSDAADLAAVAETLAVLERWGYVAAAGAEPTVPGPARVVVSHGLRLALLYTMMNETDLGPGSPEQE